MAQAEMNKTSVALEKVEKKMSGVKGQIADKEFEARKHNEKLAKGDLEAQEHNALIAKLDLIEDDIKKITEGPLKAAQADVSKANDAYFKARATYIEKNNACGKLIAAFTARYAELAKDSVVTAALEEVGEASPSKKAQLGPTGPTKANITTAEKNSKTVVTEFIPVKIEHDVPFVDVVLNGKHRRSMVLDSGASSVCLPWDLAKELNMLPSVDTQKIRLQLADGKIVEGWRMRLKSVTVGPFTVESVDCSVLPENLVAAEPLLGGSFLSHFVYKLDLKSQKLEMTKVNKATSDKPGEKTSEK
jgi:clan AA aspartic protease (TIGR02281 family)